MDKGLKKILLLASIIYLGIAPFTYHPDTKLTLYYGSFADQGVLNIYDHLAKTHDQYPPFHYPPLNYFLLQAEYKILKPLAGKEFPQWLRSGSTQAPTHQQALRFNFLSKLPLIFALLISGLIIYQIIIKLTKEKPKTALGAVTFWLLNPITIYAVIGMGQHDIFPLLCVLLSILLINKKPKISLLIAGVGVAIKTFPLIWLPFLALASAKNWQSRIKNFAIGLFPYFATTIPFLGSQEFIRQSLFSGLSQRLFDARIGVGFGDAILIVPLLMGFLFFRALKASLKEKGIDTYSLTLYLAATGLITVAFSHAHPQWFLWPVPFLAILLAGKNSGRRLTTLIKTVILLFVISFLGNTMLINDKFLTWGVLSSLNVEILNLPSLAEFLASKTIDVVLLKNLFVTLGAITAIYLSIEACRFNENET